MVNAKLIRDGNAGWKSQDAEDGNDKYADRYEKAQVSAKGSDNGLWAECSRLHSKARTKSQQRADAEASEARAAQEQAAADEAAAAEAAAEEEAAAEAAAAVPVDDYFASGPATPAEKQYMREVRRVLAQIESPVADTVAISNDPDFSTDVTLWFELVDAMRPFHSVYVSWLQLTPPTARLEVFHQVLTDAYYNYDQAATNFELFIDTVDVSYVYLTVANLEAAGNAFDQALNELNAWEGQTAFDISDDL